MKENAVSFAQPPPVAPLSTFQLALKEPSCSLNGANRETSDFMPMSQPILPEEHYRKDYRARGSENLTIPPRNEETRQIPVVDLDDEDDDDDLAIQPSAPF